MEMVRKGISLDHRIGDKFLNPGIGFGGSCFPKDIRSLVHTGSVYGENLPMLRSVLDVNQKMRALFVDKIIKHFGGDVKGKAFAVWGLAFKPNTDDMRDAPSITIIQALQEAGAKLKCYDPQSMGEARKSLGDSVEYHQDATSACHGADAVLVLTEWSEFRSPDWDRIAELLNAPLIFDGRNIYDPESIEKRGFTYYSMGRPRRG